MGQNDNPNENGEVKRGGQTDCIAPAKTSLQRIHPYASLCQSNSNAPKIMLTARYLRVALVCREA